MDNHYIAYPEDACRPNALYYFRKVIDCRGAHSAVIRIHAISNYRLYADNRLIGRGSAPSERRSAIFDEWTVRVNGSCVIAIEQYYLGEKIPLVTEQNQGKCGLNLEILIGGESIVSDKSFKCLLAPDYFRGHLNDLDPMAGRISAWGGFRECYHTGLHPDGWREPGFDDSSWKNAAEITGFEDVQSVPRGVSALVEYELPRPKVLEIHRNLGEVREAEDGALLFDARVSGSLPSVIFDFGKESVGYPELEVCGDANSFCYLSYGEGLELLRTDGFILNGKRQVIGPFHRRAFRYVKVTFGASDSVCTLFRIGAVQTHYPLEKKREFVCPDAQLKRIFDISLYTATLATQQHMEDSVFREQMQWLLDSRIVSLVIYHCFRNHEMCEKAIRQFAATQREDGSICCAGPQATGQLLPDFCMHYVIMVEEWIRLGGGKPDATILSCLDKLMRYLVQAETPCGLLSVAGRPEWWCFLDWADIDKREIVTALNCLYCQCLKSYSKILKDAGQPAEACERKRKRIQREINEKLFDGRTGLYADCMADGTLSEKHSQQTNLYAIIAEIPENPDRIIDLIFDKDFAQTCVNGSFMMCLTVDKLFEHGRNDLALNLIDRYWGEMVRRGATTWWETFDMNSNHSSVPHAYTTNNATFLHDYIPVSFCHAWGAGVAYALVKAGYVR